MNEFFNFLVRNMPIITLVVSLCFLLYHIRHMLFNIVRYKFLPFKGVLKIELYSQRVGRIMTYHIDMDKANRKNACLEGVALIQQMEEQENEVILKENIFYNRRFIKTV